MDFLYHIHIMTLFPDVVGDMLCESILGVPKSGASFVSIATKFGTIPSTSKSKWTTIPTAAAMGQ